ncbi:RNase III domain protein [Diplocarpon rosae]|nr:RNase III domain protein [Diplocarpon rosae]
MASKTIWQSLQILVRQTRAICECASTNFRTASIRPFSVSVAKRDEQYETERGERPRWSYTPEKMKAPFSWRIKDPDKQWECNTSPTRLDNFYSKLLGRGGEKVLSEELKWLAITHKSFDQGRRGFNDRLAFLGMVTIGGKGFTLTSAGRRILTMQTNIALLQSTVATKTQSLPDQFDKRVPFEHPALNGLANVTDVPISEVLSKERLGLLATQMGFPEIMRWQPRNVNNMQSSGIDVVLTTSLYAIVGAIALQKGGSAAAQFSRDSILRPLGIF